MERQTIEKKIVSKLVDDILAGGYRIAVSLERGYDVDEMLLGSTDKNKIMDEALGGDDCHLFIQPANGPTVVDGSVISKGWVYLVFGNDGWDVISDYSMKIEPLLENVNKLADKLSEQEPTQ